MAKTQKMKTASREDLKRKRDELAAQERVERKKELREHDPLTSVPEELLNGSYKGFIEAQEKGKEELAKTAKAYKKRLNANALHFAALAFKNWALNKIGHPIQVQADICKSLGKDVRASVTIWKGSRVGAPPPESEVDKGLAYQEWLLDAMIEDALDYLAVTTYGFKNFEEGEKIYLAEQEMWDAAHALEEQKQ